jgi:hypothetical protein
LAADDIVMVFEDEARQFDPSTVVEWQHRPHRRDQAGWQRSHAGTKGHHFYGVRESTGKECAQGRSRKRIGRPPWGQHCGCEIGARNSSTCNG